MLAVRAIEGVPEIRPGDDLAALIEDRILDLQHGDVLVIAHKVVSKSEGRTRNLRDVEPTAQAHDLATRLDKDPRHVQVVLDESTQLLRAERGLLICVTHHGFVCANAGVDASNVPGEDTVVLLPHDPDASARRIRDRLADRANVAVIVTDSFGRAWRNGQVDVAIGCAGLHPLEDWRGRRDAAGREMKATWIAIADELAAAADLARTKDGQQPITLIRGAERHVTAREDVSETAAKLLRPEEHDLFR
jgi:coenzyme F420-0:L-glutamate ligase / coenzyme F420-1:gamma-L-glutamate ligase